MRRYNARERRLLLGCFAAYTAAYVSRCNLAPSLDAIARAFGVTTATIGLLPTLFAIPYAAGQVVTGLLADRMPAPRLILIGLLGAAGCNLLFSFSGSFGLLLTLWFFNGVFQSLIWTPIMHIFAIHFRDEVRDNALFLLSLTIIVGYLAAWTLSGLLTSRFSWRVAFRASAVITSGVAIASVRAIAGIDAQMHIRHVKAPDAKAVQAPLSRLFLHTGLPFLLICCVCNGYIRDSIMNWATKLLIDTYSIDLGSAVGIILIIPALNFFGMRFGHWTYRKTGENVFSASIVLLAACCAFCGLLCASHAKSIVLCVTSLALGSAMSYGLNPLLTSLMPMLYRDMNRVSLAAGLIDAMIYVGSAFSGTLAGSLSDRFGWTAVFLSWALMSLAGVFALLAATRRQTTKEGKA